MYNQIMLRLKGVSNGRLKNENDFLLEIAFFHMIRDIIYVLQLGISVIGMFMFCLYIGIKLDTYFHTRPYILLVMILLAFVLNIKLLLGGIKHE